VFPQDGQKDVGAGGGGGGCSMVGLFFMLFCWTITITAIKTAIPLIINKKIKPVLVDVETGVFSPYCSWVIEYRKLSIWFHPFGNVMDFL
jgi:hypothetical protein